MQRDLSYKTMFIISWFYNNGELIHMNMCIMYHPLCFYERCVIKSRSAYHDLIHIFSIIYQLLFLMVNDVYRNSEVSCLDIFLWLHCFYRHGEISFPDMFIMPQLPYLYAMCVLTTWYLSCPDPYLFIPCISFTSWISLLCTIKPENNTFFYLAAQLQ